jgi:hypothetical protein
MNDHDAIDAINAILQRLFNGGISPVEALHKICYISGQNAIDHAEAKETK